MGIFGCFGEFFSGILYYHYPPWPTLIRQRFLIKLSALVFIVIRHVSVAFFLQACRHLDNMDTIVCPVHVPINRVPLYIESQLRKSQKSKSVNRVVLFLSIPMNIIIFEASFRLSSFSEGSLA